LAGTRRLLYRARARADLVGALAAGHDDHQQCRSVRGAHRDAYARTRQALTRTKPTGARNRVNPSARGGTWAGNSSLLLRRQTSSTPQDCSCGLLAAVSIDVTGLSDTAALERLQLRRPTRPPPPVRPSDAAPRQRRPRPPSTVSYGLLSSKPKSSSLAGIARTVAFGQIQPRNSGSPRCSVVLRRLRPADARPLYRDPFGRDARCLTGRCRAPPNSRAPNQSFRLARRSAPTSNARRAPFRRRCR
jgi:hypothetical protein